MKKQNRNPCSSIIKPLTLLYVIPLACATFLPAQPARSTNQLVQAQPPAPLKLGVDLFYSHSPESDLERSGKIGELSIGRYDFRLNANKQLTTDTSLLFGISDKYTDLDVSGSIPLPDRLHAVEFSVGAQRKLEDWFGPAWRGTVLLQTEFSNDSSGLSGAEATFGGLVSVGYQQSPTLLWTFGVLARSEGDDLPVLPVIGAKWDFAPKWTLSVGVPSTGVIYAHSGRLSLQAGISFDGGLYHVSTQRAPGLGNTWLEYQEFRAGLRLVYKFHRRFELTVGGGTVLEREFDYYDRNYSVEGDSAGYLTIGLSARF